MATLLITGFEPFGHFAVNPSQEIVKHLSRNGKPAGAVTAILPVDAAQVPGMITDLLLDLQPDLCLIRAFQSSHLILPGERTPTRAARQSPVAHRECTDSPADAGA